MNLTIAITGASGAIFGREMLRAPEAQCLLAPRFSVGRRSG